MSKITFPSGEKVAKTQPAEVGAPGVSGGGGENDDNRAVVYSDTSKIMETPIQVLEMEDASSDDEDEEEDTDASGTLGLKRVITLARPEWVWIGIGVFFLFLSLIPPLLLPLAFGGIMDKIVIEEKDGNQGVDDKTGKKEAVNRLALELITILAIGAVATAVRAFIFNAAGERVVARLRLQLFSSILRQDLSLFDERKTGELMSRLTSDCTSLQDVSTSNLSMLLRGAIELALSAVMMIITSWRLSVLAFSVVPLVVGALMLYGWRLRKVSTLATDALGETSSTAQEAIANVRTMRSFAGERLEVLRFRRALGDPDDLSVCNDFSRASRQINVGQRKGSRSGGQPRVDPTGRNHKDNDLELGQASKGRDGSSIELGAIPPPLQDVTARAVSRDSGSQVSSVGGERLNDSNLAPATHQHHGGKDHTGVQTIKTLTNKNKKKVKKSKKKSKKGTEDTGPNELCGCCLPRNNRGWWWFPPRKSRTVYRFGILKQLMNSGFIAAIAMLGYGVVLLIVWHGAHLVLEGYMTPGDLVAFLVYAVQVGGSITMLVHLVALVYTAVGAARRTFQLIDREPTIPLELDYLKSRSNDVRDDEVVNHNVIDENKEGSTPFAAYQIQPVVELKHRGAQATGVISPVLSSAAATDMLKMANITGGLPQLQSVESALDVQSPSTTKPVVEFQRVSFAYPARPDVRVLRKVSFSVKRNQTVAFVGPSGCGKSTVLNLLQRFYDVTGGRVLIDGVDVRERTHADLRAQIAWVQQEPVLFGVTIAENISYGWSAKLGNNRALPPRHLIEQAARAAFAHDFITAFPEGYDTLVGERGVRLSGGQKQRIAIARALLVDPKLLLLDEATSALDAESEDLVQKAIDAVMQDRTTFIVAHRLSTVRRADQIFLIDRHRLEASGTHVELMERSEKYRDLVRRQVEAGKQSVADIDEASDEET
ncbi:unnamed protein product [Amoebophrya sp. A25]|nr:unnamed protein product [Amoebophrya sp. A25]|eukprot:GSA25T00013275001.1